MPTTKAAATKAKKAAAVAASSGAAGAAAIAEQGGAGSGAEVATTPPGTAEQSALLRDILRGQEDGSARMHRLEGIVEALAQAGIERGRAPVPPRREPAAVERGASGGRAGGADAAALAHERHGAAA